MKYKVEDRLKDNRTGEIIKIIEVDNEGYEITVDDIDWEYGVTEQYLDASCTRLN